MAIKAQNTLNKLSRRNWLRDTTITATGVAVLPSLLNSCIEDHRIPPNVGVEDVPLTTDELKLAAQNLLNMDAFMADVHSYNTEYELFVHETLKSSVENPPSGFKTFLLSLITAIVIGIMGVVVAVTVVTPGVGPLIGATIGAAIAIVSLNIKTWGLDEKTRPGTLEAEFARFDHSQLQMRKAMSDMLILMADEKDNYKNLREGWKDAIDFNGKKYTLRDLANAQFPTVHQGTAYVALRTAATDQFKRYIWNVMIAKAGTMKSSPSSWTVYFDDDLKPPTYYGRETHYTEDRNKSTYLRGKMPEYYGYMEYREWLFTFDGRELSPAAAHELFKDDTPGHIINPTGLFNRDYVFKQFHREKPDFLGYHDLKKDLAWGPYDENHSDAYGYEWIDDFVFTGGDFPQLIK